MRRMDFDRALFRGTPERLREVLVEQWRMTPNIHTLKSMLTIVPRARQDQALAILEGAVPDAHRAMERLRAIYAPKEPPAKPEPAKEILAKALKPKSMDQAAENTAALRGLKTLGRS